MKQITIETEKVEKKFANTLLFKNLSLTLARGDSFYITGPNGAGKSTLLQILAGIQRPTSGDVIHRVNGNRIDIELFREFYGFTGPQVNPYDMLTSMENLRFSSSGTVNEGLMIEYLERFGLYRHRAKPVKYYSSGMKQRLKLIHALIKDPEVLLLDEPCSNLDTKGRNILYTILDEIKKDKIMIIATNESEDINLCSKGIDLEQQNTK